MPLLFKSLGFRYVSMYLYMGCSPMYMDLLHIIDICVLISAQSCAFLPCAPSEERGIFPFIHTSPGGLNWGGGVCLSLTLCATPDLFHLLNQIALHLAQAFPSHQIPDASVL